jgi:group I intron endonuclease
MPYAEDFSGIYVIRNELTGNGYVGQSARMRKRIADHFNLLRKKTHPNPHLQNAFLKYGESAFSYDFEIVCEDVDDLDALENAYLSGEAAFDKTRIYYNIATVSASVMRDRSHTAETKAKISESKKGGRAHITPEYRQKLSQARRRRALSDSEYRNKVIFVVENPHMSYAERGRVVGIDTSTTRKIALRYTPYKDELHGEY